MKILNIEMKYWRKACEIYFLDKPCFGIWMSALAVVALYFIWFG